MMAMIHQGLPRRPQLLLRRALLPLLDPMPAGAAAAAPRTTSRRLRALDHLPRHLASESSSSRDDISECVRSLSLLGRHGQGRQQGDGAIGSAKVTQEFAEMLSPEARREVVAAAHKALDGKTNEGGLAAKGAEAEAAITEASPQDAAAETVPEPSRRDLQLVAVNQAIPFVGFGVMDNAILILAGDAIDNSLGVMFGISTLCAAALGNIISDVAGVGLGTVIEDFCARLGIPQPNLTQAQRQLRSVRFTNQFGCAFGLIVGCIIGMFPLLFLDSEKAEKAKDEQHLDDMFKDMVTEAKELIGAEYTGLFLVVDHETETSPRMYTKRERKREGGYLYCKHNDGSDSHAHVPIGDDVLSSSALSGKIVNVSNLDKEEEGGKMNGNVAAAYGINAKSLKSMTCVPVHDALGNVVAVIQAINKVGTGTVPSGQFLRRRITVDWKEKGFTKDDVQVLQALATRISITFEGMQRENQKLHLRDTIKILREHGTLQLQ